ncbi:Phosphatidylserine/phosphatidylglycerophosphate/cardiolipin synthase [Halorubrum sodomense]|uniref:Phosphatidylserine/phosphatidylglycerophosphate/cardiolipin synthase n=1 Tax=Halorubrum sodomense TaxID=35743 RepID=A0A1I6FL49_HALSD|nr:phospholipase D-like domain-containing protein [Halorubrum sodomense]SFR30672.1 Phosphatidylserine/phosphatidylglycerophosphate/cardiolipin synthase [Halorubrum sodomense]
MSLRPPKRPSRVATLVLLVAVTSVACCSTAAAAPLDGGEPTPTNASDAAREPRIVELYPNPATEEDRGEYLVVSLPERGNWSLSDGYYDADIPANASGTVTLSMAPNRTASILGGSAGDTEATGPDTPEIRRLNDYFPLSASGERIELRRDGAAVDVAAYDRASEGDRWRAAWGEWRPRGYEPRSPRRTPGAAVTPFVLPDSPGMPVEPFRTADDRLFVAGYTLASERVVEALAAAADRGVRVRVLLEGSPVGGFSSRSAKLIDRLTAAGVEVRILDGEVERFRFHHPKYAVADDDAVVLTENWKPSGTGGRSNRGWGALVEGDTGIEGSTGTEGGTASERNATVADDLAALFLADFRAHDARRWRDFRADTEFYDGGRANGSFPTRFEAPREPAAANVTVLTAPGNAADRIVARIDAADERVLAVVPRVGGPDGRIVRALRRAADRGVDVHLLLSNAWYDREENRNLSAALANEPIAVDLAAPRGRYGKVHAKGLVVDDTAIVGSLNWNPSATTNNREVLIAMENESVADFYARAYAADWRGGGVHLPITLVAGFGVALAGAGAVARRGVEFG